MAKIDFAEAFFEDASIIESDSKIEELFCKIELLEESPEIGSNILSEAIKARYGNYVRKLIVDPFIVIYEYYPEHDLVLIERLIHQRSVT